jgi:hypothetical protein
MMGQRRRGGNRYLVLPRHSGATRSGEPGIYIPETGVHRFRVLGFAEPRNDGLIYDGLIYDGLDYSALQEPSHSSAKRLRPQAHGPR